MTRKILSLIMFRPRIHRAFFLSWCPPAPNLENYNTEIDASQFLDSEFTTNNRPDVVTTCDSREHLAHRIQILHYSFLWRKRIPCPNLESLFRLKK